MRLIKATRQELPGVRELLLELGNGENGFAGADFGCGRMTFEEQLLFLEEMSEGKNLKPEWVPMTTFWFVNDQNEPIGMSRLRHELNDWLLSHGGHIGYYIRASQRRKGYGTLLLTATLAEASKLGITKILLTVNVENVASRQVIEAIGGELDDIRDDATGKRTCRYWIDLDDRP